MNTKMAIVALLLATTACSKASDDTPSRDAVKASDSSAAGAPSASDESGQAPRISADVAPGVAFDFSYDFSLPEGAISETQERHAALCGKLGLSHCRVTGLTYSKQRDGDINANMSFKLDPAMALSFTREASDMVSRADGKLESSNVEGTNIGDKIVANDKSVMGMKAELANIEAELKIPGLSKSRREDLSRRAADRRHELETLATFREGNLESLATTPVQFTYEPNGTVLGFDRGSPVSQGLNVGISSLGGMLSFMAIAIGLLAPWSLIGFGVWWIVRRVRAKKMVAAAE